jgi:phosphoenolpyruvate carboxykinase (ATP)
MHVFAGWAGGGYGSGHRISLTHTRAIVDAIHSGQLQNAAYATTPIFNLQVSSYLCHP